MTDPQKKFATQIGAATGKAMITTALGLLGIGLAVSIAVTSVKEHYWPRATDLTDQSPALRSGLKLRIDYGTGCQYLETSQGDLFPRMSAQGHHICDVQS